MNNPETVIRRYLEAHGGRAEAHIRHLTDSWELTEVGKQDLEAIKGALAGVGVATDPPLPKVTKNGHLTLYIGEAEAGSEAEPEATESAEERPGREYPLRRRRFMRRSNRRGDAGATKASATAVSEAPSHPSNGRSATEPPPETSEHRPTEAASMVEALFEQERADVDAPLEELARGRAELQQRLAEVSDELARARADAESARESAGGDVEGQLTQLEGRLQVISVERQAQFEALFRNLVQAERQVAGAHEERDAEAAQLERELADAQSRVAGARAAMNEALSAAELRGELDARVAALSESEGLERELRERQVAAAQRWADQLLELHDRVSRAREALGDALMAGEATEAPEPRADPALAEAVEALTQARVRVTGAEQRMVAVLDALDRGSARADSVREELDQRISGFHQEMTNAILGAERRAALEGRLDDFIRTHRRELERVQLRAEEGLASVRERLEQTRAELGQERAERAEIETALGETRTQLKQAHDELEQAQAGLQRGREERSQLEQRAAELEQRHSELEQRFAEAEQRAGELRSTLDNERDEHQRLLEDAEQRLANTHQELHRVRDEADQSLQAMSTELHATREQLEETERRFELAMRDAEEAWKHEHQAAEAAAADRERIQERTEALQAEMEELRAERDPSVARLNEVMWPIDAAARELSDARAQLENSRAGVERLTRAIVTAEQRLEEKQAALAEAAVGNAEVTQRHAATKRVLAELGVQGHETAAQQYRAELGALNQELESALAEAERRGQEATARSRVVTETQRSAASALFVEAEEAAKLELQLHEAIAHEQESRAALEGIHVRAARLRQQIASLKQRIADAEAKAEAAGKLPAKKPHFEELRAGLPAAEATKQEADKAVRALREELERLRTSVEGAGTAIQEREALVEECRLALEEAHRHLHQEASRQTG